MGFSGLTYSLYSFHIYTRQSMGFQTSIGRFSLYNYGNANGNSDRFPIRKHTDFIERAVSAAVS